MTFHCTKNEVFHYGFLQFLEEIFDGKLHVLCSVRIAAKTSLKYKCNLIMTTSQNPFFYLIRFFELVSWSKISSWQMFLEIVAKIVSSHSQEPVRSGLFLNIFHCTKNKVSMKDFSSKCDQIRRKLKKSSMKNLISCAGFTPMFYFYTHYFGVIEMRYWLEIG